ncbi:hypothetical protein [Campylobacter ureolyticus]|uniref:Uncharacterized protein n=1 Tax=Campylobacter ureolyticus TaxID=827 RepID=A0A9Q4PSN7_9BACT|nr:hypothetical protein [Campylobacter ureolyticus]MCZ6160448.1 hypothetical protein [Campylobacter ureolyticus]MCZ6164110.1 hypothetical protein [Campylobacter ureolyticus]MCZ6165765.1 hypothetical protein [Campylobacter ureolyticus]
MIELYELSLSLHSFFSKFFIVLSLIFLALIRLDASLQNGVKFHKRVRFFIPFYSFSLSALIFTGVIMLPVINFHISFKVFLMILASIIFPAFIGISFKALKKGYYAKNYENFKKKATIFISAILVIAFILEIL